MKIFYSLLTSALSLFAISASAQHYVLSTPKTSIAVTANQDGKAYIQYYGAKIEQNDIQGLFNVRSNFTRPLYPQHGYNNNKEEAISAILPDGNTSLDLAVASAGRSSDPTGQLLVVTLKDKVYPVQVKVYFKAYNGTDIISTWSDITNLGKRDIKLNRYCSAFMPLQRGDNYLVHMHGAWAAENEIDNTPVPNGEIVLAEKDGMRTAWVNNPSIMMTLDGSPREESGQVFGGTLLWSGNYKIRCVASNRRLTVIAGINEDNSQYTLEGGETFTTPEFAMTFSNEGKGGVSRAFHTWARKYALQHGDRLRDILLNSWEGVYFDISQPKMEEMMANVHKLGGELFVMDDGWFGNKYPRNNGTSSLGDWTVDTRKLPGGIKSLTEAAKRHGVKFGIWIEPEMANIKSELYEKHPDWILQVKNRKPTVGRGGTQVLLDLCNPKVQDFVYSVTDNLMKENPDIAYIKWDCNFSLMDWGSTYLPADRQSELNVRYHMGLRKVLQRIRTKYPDLVIQCCASGGGRISYGFLPWFDEFWCSDNTDAFQRLFIQWGTSHFYPAIAMAAHVSASPNHQTKRETPFKFRFDVAMQGRLGIELDPAKMSNQEREFATRAIASYKEIRPVVQLGDLYRLISPFEHKCISALMYASPDKSKLVVYAYNLNYLYYQGVPAIKLTGADENKVYRIKDLTPWDASKPCPLNGKTVSGRVLHNSGLQLDASLNSPMASVVLELVAE